MCYSITTHAPLPRAHTLPPACSSLTSLQPPSPPQGRLPRAWRPKGDNALRMTCTQHTDLLPRPRYTGPRTQTLSGLGHRPGYPFLPWWGLTWESRPGLCPPQPAGWTPRPRYMWVQGGAQRLKGRRGTLGGLVLCAPPNPGQPGMKHPGSWHFIPSSHRFLAAPCHYCPHCGQQACRVETRVQGHSSGQSRNLNTGRLAPGPTFPPGHAAQAASHPQGWGAPRPAPCSTHPLADRAVLDGQLVTLRPALGQQVLHAGQLLLQQLVLLLQQQHRGHLGGWACRTAGTGLASTCVQRDRLPKRVPHPSLEAGKQTGSPRGAAAEGVFPRLSKHIGGCGGRPPGAWGPMSLPVQVENGNCQPQAVYRALS